MMLEEKFRLSNGVEIPKLGLGTWFIENDDAVQAVKDAVEIGYRHIDTAQAYQNEEGVGKGIKECGVKREDLFITTKLGAEVKSYEDAVKSIESSLKALDLDYIDLMIIHSPQPWNLAADENQEPHTDGGCDRCLGAITISEDAVTRNPAYYIIAQASKFVRPGSRRIESILFDDLSNVAFKTPSGNIVIIVLNTGSSNQKFNISVGSKIINCELAAGAAGTYIYRYN